MPETATTPTRQTTEENLLDRVVQQTPSVNFRSIWKGEDQTYETYDKRVCVYSVPMLDAVLGQTFATAPTAEKAAFLAYCINTQLDPVRKQVYFVKYDKDVPASFVVNWEVYLDRAQRHPQFDGYEAGVVWKVQYKDEIGVPTAMKIERGGPCDYTPDAGHPLMGGWARVFRKDRTRPHYVEVPLQEMMAKKRDGSPTKFWQTMPTTMSKKTCTARALRQSFPEELAGLYTEGETELFADAARQSLQSGDTIKGDALDVVAEQLDGLEPTTEETSNGQRTAFLAALSGAKTPDDVHKVRDAYLPKLPDQAQEWAHEKVGEALSEMVEQ